MCIQYVVISRYPTNGSQITPRKRARKQQLNEFGPQGAKCFQMSAPPQHQPYPVVSYIESAAPNVPYNADVEPIMPSQFTMQPANDENRPPKNVTYFIKRPKSISLLDVSVMQS